MISMRYLLLALLMILAPLSRGEDIFSCDVERRLFLIRDTLQETTSDEESGKVIIRRNANLVSYKDSAPTFIPIQFDVSSTALEVCFDENCMPAWTASGGSDQTLTLGPGLLEAGFRRYQFVLTTLQFGRAFMISGTCTKF